MKVTFPLAFFLPLSYNLSRSRFLIRYSDTGKIVIGDRPLRAAGVVVSCRDPAGHFFLGEPP